MIKYTNMLRTYSQSEMDSYERKYIRNFGDQFKEYLNGQNCKYCGRNVFQNYDRFEEGKNAVSYGNGGNSKMTSCPHCDKKYK